MITAIFTVLSAIFTVLYIYFLLNYPFEKTPLSEASFFRTKSKEGFANKQKYALEYILPDIIKSVDYWAGQGKTRFIMTYFDSRIEYMFLLKKELRKRGFKVRKNQFDNWEISWK